MRRIAVVAAVSALAILGAGCATASRAAGPAEAAGFAGTPLGGTPAPSFALHDDRGRPVSLSALRGNFVLVTFLYTHCPDVCPLIATNLAVVLRQLPSNRRNVRAVAISVDPKGDTAASVRAFVRVHRLPPTFLYAIGTRPQLQRVWAAYGIAAQRGPENTVNHSAYTVLIDPRGKERVLYDAQVKPRAVLHDLRVLA
jgi:protein SCO1/2